MSNKPRFSGEWVKLGDVLHVVHGKNQKAVEDQNGEYPIYGSGGQMGWASDYICPGDTVIIGRKGNINKPIYVSEPFWNVDTAFGLVPKPELLNARYLFHFCNFFNFETLNTTCTIPSLTRKNVEAIKLFLPPLEVQNKRSVEFDTILGQIVLAQGQLASLDSLVKSQFVEMFGDASDGITIPLKECCSKICGGKTPSMKHPEYYGGTIPFIKSGDVKGNAVSSGALWLSDAALEQAGVKLVKRGSVLVVTRSALLQRKMCSALCADDVAINQDIKAFEPKEGFSGSYLLWAIRLHEQRLLAGVRSVSTSALDFDDLCNLPIKVTSGFRQQEFADFVAKVDKSKYIARQQIEKLQTLYDSLAQEYFS